MAWCLVKKHRDNFTFTFTTDSRKIISFLKRPGDLLVPATETYFQPAESSPYLKILFLKNPFYFYLHICIYIHQVASFFEFN
jgi:hypothetical protein